MYENVWCDSIPSLGAFSHTRVLRAGYLSHRYDNPGSQWKTQTLTSLFIYAWKINCASAYDAHLLKMTLRPSVISTWNVTNSWHSKCTNIIRWIMVAKRETPFCDKNSSIAARKEYVLDICYPHHEKLLGGTDLVHGVLCEGATFIAYRSQSVRCLLGVFDGQCQVIDNGAVHVGVHMIHSTTSMPHFVHTAHGDTLWIRFRQTKQRNEYFMSPPAIALHDAHMNHFACM